MGRVEPVNEASSANPEQIIRLLTERGLTLAVAESCTGGLIGHLLTQVPGSSEAFLGGVIVYANTLKETVGVPPQTLEEHGAVSAQTAEALATGIRRWAPSYIGLAVTGIAGPGGATDAKPVGLVYIGLADDTHIEVEQHNFRGERSEIKRSAADAALTLLENTLTRESGIHPEPRHAS
jgi:PncC family amidohydrolase